MNDPWFWLGVVLPSSLLLALGVFVCVHNSNLEQRCLAAGGVPHLGRGIFVCLKPGVEVPF